MSIISTVAGGWKLYLAAAAVGAILAGMTVGGVAWAVIAGKNDSITSLTTERDTFKASADSQADAVKARQRTIDRLNAQTLLILDDWRDTRAAGRDAQATIDNLEARYRGLEASMTEKSNADGADPVDLAIDGLRQLCREQAGTAASAGGC